MTYLNQFSNTGTFYVKVDSSPLVEPLDGMLSVDQLMERFPDTVYQRGKDSHLYRFLTALAGESGAGLLKKQSVYARLKWEGPLLVFKDLDNFYTKINFKRLPKERYDYDPDAMFLEKEVWDKIQAADSSYKKRVQAYFQGLRLGPSPSGIALIARGGSGENMECVENYRYVFDQLSDDLLGVDQVGKSNSTQEFILLPYVKDNKNNTAQTLTITVIGTPTGGPITLSYQSISMVYSWNTLDTDATRAAAIQAMFDGYDIFRGNVSVSVVGTQSYKISFSNPQIDIFQLVASENLAPSTVTMASAYPLRDVYYVAAFTGPDITKYEAAYKGGFASSFFNPHGELLNNWATSTAVFMDPAIEFNMVDLLDRVRPVHTVMTTQPTTSRHNEVGIRSVFASTERVHMSRFVTGDPNVQWPDLSLADQHYIQGDVTVNVNGTPQTIQVENEATYSAYNNRSLPVVFHTIFAAIAYKDTALTDITYNTNSFYALRLPLYESHLVGSYNDTVTAVYPFLRKHSTGSSGTLSGAEDFKVDYLRAVPETPLIVTVGVTG